MSVLDDHLKKHRKRIIDREEQTFRELLAAYDDVQRELRRQILILQNKIDAAVEAGETINPSWFAREQRLEALLDQVKKQIERFGGTAAGITAREQRAAIDIAVSQARETVDLIAGAGASFRLGGQINPRVVENAVGMMGDGSPIVEYYKTKLAPAVVEAIRSEVVKAAAMGTDFRTIASRLMQTGDITRMRALATARTEVNRVRRETTRQFFQENSDVITGWEWVANKSPRTCAACLALDGMIFNLDQVFPQHINCRCTMIAVIDGVTRPPRQLGPEWFDELPPVNKVHIIGVDGFRAYTEGIISLQDFVGWRNSKEFGRSVYTRSLADILMNKPVAERIIETPRNIQTHYHEGARRSLHRILGRSLTDDELGGLVGALDGAKVEVINTGGKVYFEVYHPLIQRQVRSVSTDWVGRVFMENEVFVKTRTAPSGIGLKSFATQTYHAQRFGVSYIETEAVGNYEQSRNRGGQKWNGYYTWARMGYNADLGEDDWIKFPVTYRGIEDLNSLFEQENGKFVWLEHGSKRYMVFDLDDESSNWRVLRKYLQEKEFTISFR